ncbi:MAG TPA: hypothetical protein VLJ59_06865 [Mycobacteriales bacterium]|nr:hypothetical protein [Mycobacteriales bacterium]
MTGTPARAAISDHPPSTVDGDAKLYARLAVDGFAGPAYECVMDRLCSYGYRVIHAWVAAGLVFGRCAEKGVKGLPACEDWSSWTAEDIEDIEQETVAGAERKFRSDGLQGTGWQPDGGASLAAYFITGCLFAFASAYKHRRRKQDQHHAAQAAAQQAPPHHQAPDIADTVIARAEAAERIAQMIPDPRLRLVIQLHADGWSNAEISQVLADGTTPRAVEGMIYRCKRVNRGDSDGHR